MLYARAGCRARVGCAARRQRSGDDRSSCASSADPAAYPWLAVVGIDPFTQREQPLQRAIASSGTLDVRIPRAHFADYPRTEVRLFASAAAAQSGSPALMIFYHGVPDTTPEFADAGRSSTLSRRPYRASPRASRSKAP